MCNSGPLVVFSLLLLSCSLVLVSMGWSCRHIFNNSCLSLSGAPYSYCFSFLFKSALLLFLITAGIGFYSCWEVFHISGPETVSYVTGNSLGPVEVATLNEKGSLSGILSYSSGAEHGSYINFILYKLFNNSGLAAEIFGRLFGPCFNDALTPSFWGEILGVPGSYSLEDAIFYLSGAIVISWLAGSVWNGGGSLLGLISDLIWGVGDEAGSLEKIEAVEEVTEAGSNGSPSNSESEEGLLRNGSVASNALNGWVNYLLASAFLEVALCVLHFFIGG